MSDDLRCREALAAQAICVRPVCIVSRTGDAKRRADSRSNHELNEEAIAPTRILIRVMTDYGKAAATHMELICKLAFLQQLISMCPRSALSRFVIQRSCLEGFLRVD